MLKILGWIIVIWLFGSTAYSTKIHLRNYFSSKSRDSIVVKDLEYMGQYSLMKKEAFLRRVLLKQIIKLAISCTLIFILI